MMKSKEEQDNSEERIAPTMPKAWLSHWTRKIRIEPIVQCHLLTNRKCVPEKFYAIYVT